MATDFLGQTLNVGDDVIFLNYNRTSANLERGEITKLFPHTAEIGMKRRAEYKIVKILTDVAPVVHARWEWLGPNRLVTDCMCGTCSACKVRSKYIVNTMLCPNCGAKMDGGDSNAKSM